MTAVVVDLKDGKSSIRLSILNRHPEAAWEGDLSFTGFDVEKVEVHELYSDDLTAVVSAYLAYKYKADVILHQNSFENPENVVPKVSQLDASAWSKKEGKHTVQKHSWQFLIFEGKYKK
jgi:alpha-N-arabinofuranosidase